MRIKLTIEYDGTSFYGWQKQNNFISVQEVIEQAICQVFDNSEAIELYGAGRTDTGVHATGQIAHFEIFSEKLVSAWQNNIAKLADAINFYLLNRAIVIVKSEIVSDDFHARFSAKMRHYKYLIYNRRAKSVIYANRAWHIPKFLDTKAMHEASQYFLGTHNLNSFRSLHCNAQNPVRTISNIKVYRDADFVIMEISARSFLHNQVRITIGTLKQIGEHKHSPEHIKELLDKQDRRIAGVTAPPYGLYLTGVDY